jgi:hypothetical protein
VIFLLVLKKPYMASKYTGHNVALSAMENKENYNNSNIRA